MCGSTMWVLAKQSRLEDLGFERMQRIFAVIPWGRYCVPSGSEAHVHCATAVRAAW